MLEVPASDLQFNVEKGIREHLFSAYLQCELINIANKQ